MPKLMKLSEMNSDTGIKESRMNNFGLKMTLSAHLQWPTYLIPCEQKICHDHQFDRKPAEVPNLTRNMRVNCCFPSLGGILDSMALNVDGL